MTDTVDLTGPETIEDPASIAPVKSPPIESRFLFVDVAAMRAKQLRRGARPRLGEYHEAEREVPMKPERVAMEEVRRGLVQYEVPQFKPKTPDPRV